MLSFVSTDRSRDASGNISDEADRLHGIISREIYAYCAIKPSNDQYVMVIVAICFVMVVGMNVYLVWEKKKQSEG